MEQVRRLVPVDPHATKVVAQEVVERIPREEAEAVWNPVGLITRVIEIWLGASSQVANCLGTLLIGARPDAKCNTVESMARILLEDVGMMNAMRLTPASADFNIMGETSLFGIRLFNFK
jgi:hypothetical protein